MSEPSYQLKIITSEKVFYEGTVVSTVAPAELGYMGILAHHAPLVATCVPGKLYFREPDGTEHNFQMDSGFLEVLNNQVTILTKQIQPLENQVKK